MATDKDYEKLLLKISKNIKNLRIEHGYTQEDMTQFGFNYRHYQKLESGKHSPSLSTLFKISSIFSQNIKNLLE